jgi:hypothetical protein
MKKGVVEEEILHWTSPPLATALPDPELGRGAEEDESTTSTSSPPAVKRVREEMRRAREREQRRAEMEEGERADMAEGEGGVPAGDAYDHYKVHSVDVLGIKIAAALVILSSPPCSMSDTGWTRRPLPPSPHGHLRHVSPDPFTPPPLAPLLPPAS